jgi:X-Pro dipeptidyl-peptidase
MQHRSRAVLGGAVVALALLPAAASAAGPSTKLSSVSSPPSTAEPGDAFTLTSKVRNTAARSHRVRLTVSLRTARNSKSGRIVAIKQARVRARSARTYKLRVRVPASLAAARYHVAACARVGNRRASCKFTKRRLTVTAAPSGSGGAPRTTQPSPRPAAGQQPDIEVENGRTQPVFGYADAVRQRVWVPIEYDTDRDGTDDRIAIDIIRPRATATEGLEVPTIIDASPYYNTVCRGNEGQCKQDVDGDGINDKWPLFYDNYFVPRGYAMAYLDTVGTNNSTGCPTVGGVEDIRGMTRFIDWLNGRAAGFDAQHGGNRVQADWSTGNAALIGKSFDGTHANGAAATGVEGLRTIVPISAISSWYKYYRINGLRFTNTISGLSNTVTHPTRRDQCAPLRQRLATGAGEGTQPPETVGNFNEFWAERDYEVNADKVRASVFLIHGLNDYNVDPPNYDEWWDNLAANDVPRKIWLTQTGHEDPFDFDRHEWVDTLHGWFDYWLQDVDNEIMDEPMARIEQQPNLTGRTPTYREYPTFPDAGARPTDVWFRTPAEADDPFELSTTRQQAAATASWLDNRDQLESAAMADPESRANPNRLVFLSPELQRGVRISGRSSIRLRVSSDQPWGALGAILVDYSDEPFEAIAYDDDEGLETIEDAQRECFGESSFFDNGCYLPLRRLYRSVTAERVGRAAIDPANRDSLWAKTPMPAGQKQWVQIPVWGHDYTFLAGHRIGVVLVGTNRNYFERKTTPAPTFEINVHESKITLPVVGGRDQLGF